MPAHSDDCPCCSPILLRHYALSDSGDVEEGEYFWWRESGDGDDY